MPILSWHGFTGKTDSGTKAVATLETAVKKDPQAPLPANNLAWLYLEHDDTNISRAFALAQSAYERLPKDAAVADTLGWAYYKKNIFTQAVWLLEEARSIDPEQPLIHFHLGMVFNAQGNTTASKKSLKQALALNLAGPQREEAIRIIADMNKGQ